MNKIAIIALIFIAFIPVIGLPISIIGFIYLGYKTYTDGKEEKITIDQIDEELLDKLR